MLWTWPGREPCLQIYGHLITRKQIMIFLGLNIVISISKPMKNHSSITLVLRLCEIANIELK
jgi:hypothetical protein